MFPIRTILHPTDFSRQSAHAFRLACALARDHGATVIVLHVIPPPVSVYGNGIIPPEPAALRDEAGVRLAAINPDTPDLCVGHRLAEGDPVAEVVRAARQIGADLVVMGTHGWTGLSRLLMGSVAEGVMRRVACPVLTVKARFPTAEPAEVAGQRLATALKQRARSAGRAEAATPR